MTPAESLKKNELLDEMERQIAEIAQQGDEILADLERLRLAEKPASWAAAKSMAERAVAEFIRLAEVAQWADPAIAERMRRLAMAAQLPVDRIEQLLAKVR